MTAPRPTLAWRSSLTADSSPRTCNYDTPVVFCRAMLFQGAEESRGERGDRVMAQGVLQEDELHFDFFEGAKR
jgi:hypothetical protein